MPPKLTGRPKTGRSNHIFWLPDALVKRIRKLARLRGLTASRFVEQTLGEAEAKQ